MKTLFKISTSIRTNISPLQLMVIMANYVTCIGIGVRKSRCFTIVKKFWALAVSPAFSKRSKIRKHLFIRPLHYWIYTKITRKIEDKSLVLRLSKGILTTAEVKIKYERFSLPQRDLQIPVFYLLIKVDSIWKFIIKFEKYISALYNKRSKRRIKLIHGSPTIIVIIMVLH